MRRGRFASCSYQRFRCSPPGKTPPLLTLGLLVRVQVGESPAITLPFEKGEALFLGAAGSKRGDDPWEIAFAFAGSPNVTGVTVGDITIAAKEGWAYLWMRYQAAEDTTNKLLVMKPVMAIVERVYDYGNFGSLAL